MSLGNFNVVHFGTDRWVRRVQLSVDKLLVTELTNQRFGGTVSGIQRAFEYWRDKQYNGRVTLANFELESGDDVATTLIDVMPSSPLHYRFMSTRFKYFRWMADKQLSDFPHREIIEACSIEYLSCKAGTMPVAHHISHDLNGFSRDYVRLLLPLTDQAGQVSALACVSRHLDSPAPAE